jgi:hypothetical protein
MAEPKLNYTIFSKVEQSEIISALEPLLHKEDNEFRPGINWVVHHMKWLRREGLARPADEGVSRLLRADEFPTSRR